jgi:ADP-ribose pyrophosphatase
MIQKLKNISSKEILKNKWWRYKVDEYIWPDGSKGDYHYVSTSGSTMIIPEIEENVFVMTRQYRYLNRRVSLEFPGGGIKPGLLPEQNAREELEEEAGYVAGKLIKIGEFNPFNGVTDEICNVFLAKQLEFVGEKPEPSEEFEVIKLTLNEIEQKIRTGELWDGMSLASWTIYLSRRDL